MTLMRLTDVRQIVPLGKTTIYEWVKTGKFPAPFRVGRAVFWQKTEIERWLRASGMRMEEDLIG